MPRNYPKARRPKRVADWPQLDQRAWARALAPASPFDDHGAVEGRRLRETTQAQYENGYGRWLTWLDFEGKLDPEAQPASRATLSQVRAYHQSLLGDGLADYSVAGRLSSLAQVLKRLEPKLDFSWIAKAAKNVHQTATPQKDQGFNLPSSDQLAQLGFDLMAEAESAANLVSPHEARLFREGLMIAFLAYRPIRVKNLSSTTLDQHLRPAGSDWRLTFDGSEMKNGGPLEFMWPRGLLTHLSRYLHLYRPVLLAGAPIYASPSTLLWITSAGGTLTGQQIYGRLAKYTKDRFGTVIGPHRFRHAAATTIANEAPDDAAQIAAILGHGTLKTSERHYNLAKGARATSRHQDFVRQQRRMFGREARSSRHETRP